ncbi:hypothetical protein CPC08DRAFT_70989 [Agrocybe pediades]|nr:hypothetical protein CPC08DRAFT_70989 [Agrocybe pediades]
MTGNASLKATNCTLDLSSSCDSSRAPAPNSSPLLRAQLLSTSLLKPQLVDLISIPRLDFSHSA